MANRRNSARSSSPSLTQSRRRRTSTMPSPFSPSASSPLRIPEPTAPLRLTTMEKAQLLELAHFAAAELTSFVFRLHSKSHKRSPDASSSGTVLRAHTSILSDYMTLNDYHAHVHSYAFNGFHATSTLCALHGADGSIVTVKWSVAKSTWTHDRDFCYLEIQKPFVGPMGHQGYLRCLHSIPLFISSSKARHIRGMIFHSGVVAMETASRQVEETIVMQVDMRGHIPKWIASILVSKIVIRARTKPYYVSNEVSKNMDGVASWQVVSQRRASQSTSRASVNDANAQCKVCLTQIHWYQPRVKCKVCQAIACKPCTTHCEALLKPTDRACLLCNAQLAAMLAKSEQPEETFVVVDGWDEWSSHRVAT
ncbi:hypothetical protein Ae201684_006825 [Aphanomyces euteiches]|uniref:FYVE-type domain-containing protein n=1 Tax=Aphanomyces euteiches TaxID=100861 RepID=A0A6G0XAF5_9STRA|nr:hypothetical protein Ae201684_006825 [Aphanomyces euteiches]KAH9140310.1 hypothetical protein AeRB84_015447 [Aphanomyces euteiches]